MKTTPEQFEQFKAEFGKYQCLFGLTDFRIVFIHEPVKDSYADINIGDHIATVRFTSEFDDGAKEGFDAAAHGRHEAIHLLLWRLYSMAGQRHIMVHEIEDEWESLVRRIEYAMDHVKEIEQ